MQVLIDSTYRGLDALTEADNLARLGFPAPPDFALANSITVPLGPRPARALILMLRADIDALSQNAYHTIALTDHQNSTTLTLHNLVFVNARCLTPGQLGDENGAYLCEFADARWLVHNPHFSVPINKQYNVRAPAWGTGSTVYYADSTNGGTAWTWQTMIQDVWGLMTQLGTAPTLPFTPNGTPEGFKFPGVPAWVSLNQLLYRIGCAVKVDLTASSAQFSIVQVGASDATQDGKQTTLIDAGRKIHDEEFIESNRGRLPYGVRVFFHRVQQDYGTEQTTQQTSAQFSTSQVYSVDVTGSYTAGQDSNTLAPIWDDLPAIYDASGAITNASACSTRASERSVDFFRMMTTGGARLHRTFAGLQSFMPGSNLKGVCWKQDLQGIRDAEHPGGWVTELVRHPYRFLRGLNDQGRWVEEEAGSIHLQPPDLSPTYPNYPHLLQVVRVNGTTPDGSGRFDAYVQVYDPAALTDSDGERVWVIDLAGASSLGSSEKYHARLQGYNDGRPIYRIHSNAGTIYGPITFRGSPINFGDAAQSSSLTINVYGAPSFPSTWNWQNNTVVVVASGSTWTYNNRPTFNNAFVLVGISAPTSLTANVLFIDLSNQLQWWCNDQGTFKFPPSISSKPGLSNQLRISIPSSQPGPGNRTTNYTFDGTTKTLTQTGTVSTISLGTTGMQGFDFPSGISAYLTLSDSTDLFDDYPQASSYRIRTWFEPSTVTTPGAQNVIDGMPVQLKYDSSTLKLSAVAAFSFSGTVTVTSSVVMTVGTAYAVEVWFNATAGTLNISVNTTTTSSNVSGTITAAPSASLTIGNSLGASYEFVVGPVEILYSAPSGTDLADWYNSGTPLPYPYNSTYLSPSVGGTGANLGITGGSNQLVKQKTLGGGLSVGTLLDQEQSPGGKMVLQASLGGL